MLTLDALAATRSLVVCVGPGGVGKTTVAAALAVRAARAGRRTAVITIDPARRLADALGLDGLDDELRRVPGLPLDAAMLETKAAYDALVRRITPDPGARDRILTNRVYQSFSRTLARSHAYVAMERLYDVTASGAHDLVVLDTPPTRSALDILDAPDRLVRFLDERVVGAFVGEDARGPRAWLRAKGTAVALRLFGAMAGEALMEELAAFFEVFVHLRAGFAERAAAVRARLADPTTSFVLVTAPDPTHLSDAAYLRDGLLDRDTPIDAVIFNRAFHAAADGAPLARSAGWPDEALDGPPGTERVRAAARALRAHLDDDNATFALARARFGAALPPTTARCALPVLDAEPTSLADLAALLDRATAPQGR
ncbi:MAG: AAA family ATPase [Sandaracinaceae bacterium]|nr:AAA family ATPase [Sandaracinaceae bacterium]